MGTKVEEEDPSDLLPKIGAEKMTRSLLRGCQFDLSWKVNKPLLVGLGLGVPTFKKIHWFWLGN